MLPAFPQFRGVAGTRSFRHVGLLAVGYFVLASAAILLSRQPGSLATVWFANAWALLFLRRARTRAERGVLLAAAALAAAAANVVHGSPVPLAGAFALVNVAEIAFGSVLLERHARAAPETAPAMLRLLGYGVFAPPLLGATLGALLLQSAGLGQAVPIWPLWYFGSAIGSLALLPAGVALGARPLRELFAGRAAVESATGVLLAVLTAALVLPGLPFPYVYITLPLVFVAMRLPVAGTALAVGATAATWAVLTGFGRVPAPAGAADWLRLTPILVTLLPPLLLAVTVAERHAQTRRLAERERFLHLVTDALPGMVGYWDAGLRCRYANRAYRTWFGREPATMYGLDMRELLGSELFARNEPYIRAALRGEPQRFERALVKVDGSIGHTWAHYVPDRPHGDDGPVAGFFVLVTDVTELKQAELALERTNAALAERTVQAEAANRAKSEFIANVSHEIRTPMNGMLGLLQVLEDTALDDRQRRYLRTIRQSARALLDILNNILDHSRIEAGRFDLHAEDFDLDELLEGAIDLFAPAAHQKRLDILLDAAAGLPARLRGDALRLHQVLANLLGNALKFTERGEICLAVERLDAAREDCARLRFRVRDTGIGMNGEQMQRLFSPYAQADGSTARRYGGTGLGLAISQRLVQLMGGEIDVDSEPGVGTTFGFELSLPLAGPARPAAPVPGRLAGVRVLVADACVSARGIVGRALRHWGCETAEAADGDALPALALAAATAQRPFRVFLIDYRLPPHGGSEAARRLHAAIVAGHLPPATTIVLLTDAERRELAIDPGLAALPVLMKPVTASRLHDALVEQLDRGIAPAADAAPAPEDWRRLAAPLRGAEVLVVEDNAVNRMVAEELLERIGVRATVAADGTGGVALACARRFDAVLMDLHMPDMDGFEATARIRAGGAHDALPIIAMTAAALDEDRRATAAAGMNDHLAKPVECEELVRVLRRWIAPRVAPAADEAAAAGPAAASSAAAAALPGFDVDAALARLGGDRALYARLLRTFRTSYAEVAARLDAGLRRGERSELVRLLHTLKGASGSIGAMPLQAAAAQLEADLRSGAGLAGLPAVHAALAATLASLDALDPPATPGAAGPEPPLPAAELRRALAETGDLLARHRLVPAALLERLRRGCAASAPGAQLLSAIEDFDYDRAREHLDALRGALDHDAD